MDLQATLKQIDIDYSMAVNKLLETKISFDTCDNALSQVELKRILRQTDLQIDIDSYLLLSTDSMQTLDLILFIEQAERLNMFDTVVQLRCKLVELRLL